MSATTGPRLAKSNHVVFAESAKLMRKHGAPAYMPQRMDQLAALAKSNPGEAARVLPIILANLPNETEIK